MMEKNWVLQKGIDQNSGQMQGCSCNLYLARSEEFLFIWQKLYSRERQIPYESSCLRGIVIEQVNYKQHYFSLYFLKEIVPTHFQSLFRRSNCDVSWKNEGKIHEGGCMNEFSFVNLQVGISQLHYRVTSSQAILRNFK